MKHLLKTKYNFTSDKEIKNKEVLNLIQEREEIDLGTQVVVPSKSGDYLLEVFNIDGDNVWWQIV